MSALKIKNYYHQHGSWFSTIPNAHRSDRNQPEWLTEQQFCVRPGGGHGVGNRASLLKGKVCAKQWCPELIVSISFRIHVQKHRVSHLKTGPGWVYLHHRNWWTLQIKTYLFGKLAVKLLPAHPGCKGIKAAELEQVRGMGTISFWMGFKVCQARKRNQNRKVGWYLDMEGLSCFTKEFSFIYYPCLRPSRKQMVHSKRSFWKGSFEKGPFTGHG